MAQSLDRIDTSLEDESRWSRVTELFDRLLAGDDLATVLASESDPEIRQAAEGLWCHHCSAVEENFLGEPMEFSVVPMFLPGQVLLQRFAIERMLGAGGMGEVYLAFDRRVGEQVALKTVARMLAPSPGIRQRIVAEVQNARRVTHPNVCRIHELFDEGETVFFTMEYVPGQLLPDALKELQPADTRLLVQQMAEGLHAAHRTGVVHGDFKPGNVMVVAGDIPRAVIMDFGLARAVDRIASSSDTALSTRGGTVDFMAPELHAGGTPSVRSDIYAFGKVGRELLPKERIWEKCTRSAAEQRPLSLEPVIRTLGRSTTRRYWVLGGAVATAGAIRYVTSQGHGPTIVLPADSRILVNGFQAAGDQIPGARLARSLFLTALQQSPRIRAIADQDVLPALRKVKPGGSLPIGGELLGSLLKQVRAAYWIDGDLHEAGGRYSLDLRLLRNPDAVVVTTSSFRDLPSVLALAQDAAQWLRQEAGESPQSVAANSGMVGQYTSEVPEALQNYYDAMDRFSTGDMAQVVPLLQEAVRLDPNFAQAHNMLGMTLNPTGRHDDAFREVEIAMRLSAKLPAREKVAIETNYYLLVEDPVLMIEAARRNVAFHPDEPRCYRVLANALSRIGNAQEAVPYNRKAVELAPDDGLQITQLEDALCESGQFSESLQEFQVGLARRAANQWIYSGAGTAYMGLERYEEAVEAFRKEPVDPENVRNVAAVRVLQGQLDVAIAAMQEYRAGANNAVLMHRANEFLCGLYYLTERTDQARACLEQMTDLPAFPPMARRLDCAIFWAGLLADDGALSKTQARIAQIAARWPNALTRAVESHAAAVQAWRRNALDEAESLLLQSSGLAFSVWTLFDLAELFTARAKFALAEDYWRKLEDRRGVILARWFPGVLILAWLHRALAAVGRNDKATAFQYSQKVLDHWSAANSRLQVVQAAKNVNAVTKPL